MAQLGSFHDALHRFPDELDRNQHKENAISKPGEDVEFAPSKRLFGAGRPFTGHSGAESNDQGQAVEEHVYRVAQETQRATDPSVKGLYQHETKVEAGEVGDAAGVALAEDAVE